MIKVYSVNLFKLLEKILKIVKKINNVTRVTKDENLLNCWKSARGLLRIEGISDEQEDNIKNVWF